MSLSCIRSLIADLDYSISLSTKTWGYGYSKLPGIDEPVLLHVTEVSWHSNCCQTSKWYARCKIFQEVARYTRDWKDNRWNFTCIQASGADRFLRPCDVTFGLSNDHSGSEALLQHLNAEQTVDAPWSIHKDTGILGLGAWNVFCRTLLS
jgi:hypothetical protein